MDAISDGVFIAVMQMIEKALLGALEGGARGGFRLPVQRAGLAGDVGRLHRRVEIVVDDGERAGIGVVDADLLVASADARACSYSTPS